MKKRKIGLLAAAISCFFSPAFTQEPDLLAGLEEKPGKEYVDYAFKSSRVIMSHSMELIKPGVMDLRILHRFGTINGGAYEFFGLDQASMRMGLDFGLTRNLMAGIGRSTYKKEIDGFLKYRLVHQAKGPGSLPFSLLLAGGACLNTLRNTDSARKEYFSSRMGYYGQLIIGRKFSEGFSLQLMPTVLHRNLVATREDPNDLLAAGVGSRIRLSRRVSLTIDYYYRLNPNQSDGSQNPFSIGFDIETGGHVFQLHFSNAAGMNEKVFLAETVNSWANGDIRFGFNISRSFQVKKKRP